MQGFRNLFLWRRRTTDCTRSCSINIKGAYFTIRKAIPFHSDGASIILNPSVADEKGMVNASVYAATKTALRQFTRSIASELVDRGIHVNTVSPGPIDTPAGFERSGEAIEEFARNIGSKVSMKRLG